MSKIDYEVESANRMNWMDLTGGTAKDGMTLLDWFAGKALGGLLAGEYNGMVEQAAVNAYDYAEAMLAERNKRFTPQGTVKGVTGKTYG